MPERTIISCMPAYIVTTNPSSELEAAADLRRLPFRARISKWPGPGVGVVQADVAWEDVVRAMIAAPPIWIRHVHPVGARAPLQNNALDLLTMETLLQPVLMDLDTGRSFSVQTRLLGEGVQWQYSRFDVNERLAALVSSWGAPLDVRDPVQVISVTCTPEEAFIGLSLAWENLSSWTGGERRFKRVPEQVSRAEFKLLEALETFRIDLPAAGRALDMGAAPGGWTRLLSEAGFDVLAVDPAELDPRVSALPSVQHIRKTVQDARLTGKFDVIVNDMRMDARDSARLMATSAELLKPGGVGVMTLKLPEDRQALTADAALRILAAQFEVIGARQLFHDRSEITVALRL